jgi:hypothetical protein
MVIIFLLGNLFIIKIYNFTTDTFFLFKGYCANSFDFFFDVIETDLLKGQETWLFLIDFFR